MIKSKVDNAVKLTYSVMAWLATALVLSEPCTFKSSFPLFVSVLWLFETNGLYELVRPVFFDTRKQRWLWLCIGLGSLTAAIGILKAPCLREVIAGMLIMFLWSLLITKAIKLRLLYRKVERGVVPVDTWIDPPSQAFQVGDVIGTTGVWWEPFHQAFAHCEIISEEIYAVPLQNVAISVQEWSQFKEANLNKSLIASSCAMGSGTYIHACEDVIRDCKKHTWLKEGYERWFCARLTEVGQQELLRASGSAWKEKLNRLVMYKIKRNRLAAIRENARRRILIKRIPFLTAGQKDALTRRLRSTGYNWGKMVFADYEGLVACVRMRFPRLGKLFLGNTQRDESDLCSTHVISILARLFNKDFDAFTRHRKNWLPFGFANPVLPMEVLLLTNDAGEPYFRLLDERDRIAYERDRNRAD